MGVPGRSILLRTVPPPHTLAGELFSTDAVMREFEARVVAVDEDERAVALDQTAFYPGGGGQPCDVGRIVGDGRKAPALAIVSRTARRGGRIWHWIDGPDLPEVGAEVLGSIDWDRRHLLMRTHTALHILCGVVWSEFSVPVTGGNMEPGSGRLDFPLERLTAEIANTIEQRINEEVAAAREILTIFVPRSEADRDPALIRTATNLIPAEIDPLRVIDIVGLDRQADGGTHIANTALVGQVRVTGTENKGRGNKRVRIQLDDGKADG